jgi:hypothetical protein
MALIRWLAALVLICHGIGHIMGFLAAWTTVPVGWQDVPWLLGGGFRIVSPVGKAWWLPLATAAAAISLVAILPWWMAAPMGARVGAIVVDLVVFWLASPLGAPLLERLNLAP